MDVDINYSKEDLQEAVGILLSVVDGLLPKGTHYYGQTPDWFVAAAMMACNIKDTEPKAITYLRDHALLVSQEVRPCYVEVDDMLGYTHKNPTRMLDMTFEVEVNKIVRTK